MSGKARCVNGVMTVDIHEMYAPDAKKYLERLLKTAGNEVREIVIVHGYHSGQALMRTDRTEVKSRRIHHRGLDMNPGITIYYLREKQP